MELFKYVGMYRGIEILKNLTIRFTQPSDYNDPFECNPVFPAEGIFKLGDERYKQIEKSVFQFVADTTLLGLSLSANKESALMWAHYADEHKGIVIEFDPNSNFIRSKKSRLCEIPYKPERPKMLSKEEMIKFLDNSAKDPLERLDEVVFTKGLVWDYEKEYRLIKQCSDFKDKNGRIFYRRELFEKLNETGSELRFNDVLLSAIQKEAIIGIYFGIRTTPEDVTSIRDILSKNDMSESVKLHQAVLSDVAFDIKFNPL